MNIRQIAITLIGIFMCLCLFHLPQYAQWYDDRLGDLTANISEQADSTDLEFRKILRWRDPYVLSRNTLDIILKKDSEMGRKRAPDSFVLLPPTQYIKEVTNDFLFPEPIAFYYFSGIKTTYSESKYASHANYYVDVTAQNMLISHIDNAQQRDSVITAYKNLSLKYKTAASK
ncbi:MAG: hypothetical protein EOP51_12670 [Sphingobacteriales bacterium]|nr:MAG: hypothetical protein EOP51_12670 [Sphingobacteriales bacterium]